MCFSSVIYIPVVQRQGATEFPVGGIFLGLDAGIVAELMIPQQRSLALVFVFDFMASIPFVLWRESEERDMPKDLRQGSNLGNIGLDDHFFRQG